MISEIIKDAYKLIAPNLNEKGQICAMRKSKVFLILAIVFVVAMAIASYDISRKTTFPGSKSQLKERLKKQYIKPDSIKQTPKK